MEFEQSSQKTQSCITDEPSSLNFNNTKFEYPYDKTITQLFEEQVVKTPNRVAASCEGKSITYKELNQKANLLAQHLIEIDTDARDVIGIMVDVSLEMLIAILGILKSGSAYLPLNIKSPEARTKFILEDSSGNIVWANKLVIKKLSKLQKHLIDLAPFVTSTGLENYELTGITSNTSPNDLAYIIYTSGSTGTPKGVAVEHRNLVNYAWWAKNQY